MKMILLMLMSLTYTSVEAARPKKVYVAIRDGNIETIAADQIIIDKRYKTLTINNSDYPYYIESPIKTSPYYIPNYPYYPQRRRAVINSDKDLHFVLQNAYRSSEVAYYLAIKLTHLKTKTGEIINPGEYFFSEKTREIYSYYEDLYQSQRDSEIWLRDSFQKRGVKFSANELLQKFQPKKCHQDVCTGDEVLVAGESTKIWASTKDAFIIEAYDINRRKSLKMVQIVSKKMDSFPREFLSPASCDSFAPSENELILATLAKESHDACTVSEFCLENLTSFAKTDAGGCIFLSQYDRYKIIEFKKDAL